MKKIFCAVSITVLLAACGGSKSDSDFQLNGTFSNANSGDVVYLEELAPQTKLTLDSAKIDDKGNFSFTHAKISPGFYRVKATEQNFAMLVLDAEKTVTLSANYKDIGNTYKTEGSEDTKVFLAFNDLSREFQQCTDSIQQAFQAIVGTLKMDTARIDSLNKVFGDRYNKLVDGYQEKFSALVIKNKASLAVFAGLQQLDPKKYLNLYKEVDVALTAKYPNSKYLINLKKDIAAFEAQTQKTSKIREGNTIPDFTLTTPEGKPLSISSFKGKVVLVDFWASWCGPCRKENPHVVALYKKLHAKGFDIYGVSLDHDKENWLAAIKADGLTWSHGSDLKGWDNEVVKQFGIDGIPFTILLNKEGKIIGTGLQGKELENAVEAALAAK